MTKPVLSDGTILSDGKDAQALRTIGEVAKALGIRQHVLRYWEEQFPSLRPLTRAGGRRYYRPEDIALIVEIDRLLHHEGFTIKGAKQALKGGVKGDGKNPIEAKQADVGSSANLSQGEVAQPLIDFLQGIRNRLAAALD